MTNEAKELQLQGAAMMGKGMHKEAKEYFSKALTIEKNLELYMDLGNATASLGEYDEAVEAFSNALMIEPDNGEVLFNIGSVYLLQKKFKKTLEFYNKAEEKGFKKVVLYTNFAAIYKALGDTQMELRNYTKAIEANPLRGDLYVKKISLYIEQRRFHEALNTLEELRKVVPDAFEGYDLAAKIHLGFNENEKAIEVLLQGIEKFPKDLNIRNSLVSVYIKLNEIEKAESIIKEMKEIDVNNIFKKGILYQEISIAAAKEQKDVMYVRLEDVIALENETCDEHARYMMLMICMADSKYEKALEMAEVLDRQDTNSNYMDAGIFYKADLLKKMGKETEAREQFEKASAYFRRKSIQKQGTYDTYLYRALCYKELEKYDKALEMADFIENLEPNRAESHVVRAEVYRAMGEELRSEEAFARATEKNPALKRKE